MGSDFSDWSLWIKRLDNSIYDTYKYLSTILPRSDAVFRAISWIAERIESAEQGGVPEPGELDLVAGMLGCRSVTLSGCARELLVLYHGKMPAEVGQRLLKTLECGELRAKKDAIEVILKSGRADAIPEILGALGCFARRERVGIIRDIETLAGEKAGEMDLAGVRKALHGQVEMLARKGDGGAAEEMRSYFSRIRKAMADGGICDAKRWSRGKARCRGPALIRKAC